MLLSIILVNYNGADLLRSCLDSIRKTRDNLDLEIIVVANKSPHEDQLPKLLAIESDFRDLNLRLIILPHNLGFGTANNRGAQIAQGKYLLALNADTILKEKSIREMIQFLENHLEAGIAGPKLLTQEGEVQEWGCGPRTSIWRIVKNNIGFIPHSLWLSLEPIKVDMVSGAALMVRKEVFERVKGFDENFFMYFEDEDLCWRVKDFGYDVYYLGNVTITHLGGQSFKRGETKSLQKKLFYESQDYFFKKHYGVVRLWVLKVLRSLAKN